MKYFLFLSVWLAAVITAAAQNKIIVFQSDFGLKDGAVSAMKGVAMGVSPELKLFDLTHDIPPFHIWEAAYRLEQTVPYWPAGTVFVSVVDPGVGTSRKSVVVKTRSGHFIVTPDNGTLTLVAESLGIAERHEIDEAVNRRAGSGRSYTFHGRDVYAYTAARLAAGIITLNQVGPRLSDSVEKIPYTPASISGKTIRGGIPILDVAYGNIWTNIPSSLFLQNHPAIGSIWTVRIYNRDSLKFTGDMPYVETFGEVPEGKPLLYLNSLMQVSFALNEDNFAAKLHIGSG